MIKTLTVTNHLGDEIELELMRPEKSGFLVKSIDGLGPTKATINMSDMALHDGAVHNSAYLNTRNIVLNLGFISTDKETIEDIRHKSYKYFPIKRNVKITIETDNRVSETEGYIEDNQPNIFDQNEGCSITIVCADPYFYAKATNTVVFSGLESVFNFPFTNEVNEPKLVISEIQNKKEQTIWYDGDSEIGVIINIHAIGSATNLSIYNRFTNEQMHIDSEKLIALTGSDIKFGDDITIDTRKGHKSITLLRDGETKNILSCLKKNSDWFTLAKGDNIFIYKVDGEGSTSLQFSIKNKIIYDGV